MKNFPIKTQPKKSNLCGPACIQMTLEYFGKKRTLEEINKKIRMRKGGTSFSNIGKYFIKNGFEVKLFCLNTGSFNYSIAGKKSKEQIVIMEGFLEKKKKKNRVIKETIDFIKAGGIFDFKITNFEEIKTLMKNYVLMARIDGAVLYKNRKVIGEGWHSVIPSKIIKKNYNYT